jgi:hypothetical protein
MLDLGFSDLIKTSYFRRSDLREKDFSAAPTHRCNCVITKPVNVRRMIGVCVKQD